MLTVPAFQSRFQEFERTDPTLVGSVLAEAQRAVAPSAWGALTDDGVGYLAAHTLASDPAGTSTALIAKPDTATYGTYGSTTYGIRFFELRASVVIAFGVAGGRRC